MSAPESVALPGLGWDCPKCGAFNGDVKERLEACRCCDASNPYPIPDRPIHATRENSAVKADVVKTQTGLNGTPFEVDEPPGREDAPVLCGLTRGEEDWADIRVAVAALGKRALRLVLEHEWCGEGNFVGASCPECVGGNPEDINALHPERYGHKPGCQWGAIVAEVAKLRGAT